MSALLGTVELAQMRADQLATMADETCTVLTPSGGTNAIGEWVVTWGTAGTAVPCRLRSIGMPPYMVYVGGQANTLALWSVTMPYGTVVNPGDRIVVDTKTYEVVQTYEESTWSTATRADVKQIE